VCHPCRFVAALVSWSLASGVIQAADSAWVTTWGCAPQLTEPGNLPPAALTNSTLRQYVRTTIPGKQLRLRLCNAFGTEPVVIESAHLALSNGKGSAGAGEVRAGTDTVLKFKGSSSVTLGAGETVLSDAADFDLPPLADVAVSLYIRDISTKTITGHPGSRTTSFIMAGDAVSATNLPAAAKTAHWYLITGIEVMAHSSSHAIVVLGDSITDGRGSTTDGNNRWPDVLAGRLAANPATARVSVVNMGIGGNAIFGGLGPAAVKRFERDVLGQSGARWLIVFEGVNDIGGANEARAAALSTNLLSAYAQFAEKAHAKGLRAYGATITPFGGAGYFTPYREELRQTVNSWMRTNTVFDGVIDFDAVVRNPVSLTNLLSTYDTGDHLHLNPAGYKAMADKIDLNLFAHE
jgi:lysophospholipase L1-like esterase